MIDEPSLEEILIFHDPKATLITSKSAEIPPQIPPQIPPLWYGYLHERKADRLQAAYQELEAINSLMPMAYKALKQNITDAYLINTIGSSLGVGLFRVFNVTVNDGTKTCWLSKPPLGQDTSKLPDNFASDAPKDLLDFYTMKFDGLTNIFGNGGILPSYVLKSVSDAGYDLSDAIWFDELESKTDITRVYEVALNGGDISALLDLTKSQYDASVPKIIWVDNEEGIETFSEPLWIFLDHLMEISATN